MGSKIDRPEWFTLEKYQEYLSKEMNQEQIAAELFVSRDTLKRFLKEIGAPGRGLRPKYERPSWLTKETYLKMRKVGYGNPKIMQLANADKHSFKRMLKEIGVTDRERLAGRDRRHNAFNGWL